MDHVDHALELVLGAQRQLHHDGTCVEFRPQLGNTLFEVRSDAVHLVHKDDAGHPVFVRLAPHRLRLGLDAFDGP